MLVPNFFFRFSICLIKC